MFATVTITRHLDTDRPCSVRTVSPTRPLRWLVTKAGLAGASEITEILAHLSVQRPLDQNLLEGHRRGAGGVIFRHIGAAGLPA